MARPRRVKPRGLATRRETGAFIQISYTPSYWVESIAKHVPAGQQKRVTRQGPKRRWHRSAKDQREARGPRITNRLVLPVQANDKHPIVVYRGQP